MQLNVHVGAVEKEWEALIRSARETCRGVEAADGAVAEQVMLLFEASEQGLGPKRHDEGFEAGVPRVCVKKGAELAGPELENPLDDQEKLDEVRRIVFGSAPNTKSGTH
jgi:hypothetical protein